MNKGFAIFFALILGVSIVAGDEISHYYPSGITYGDVFGFYVGAYEELVVVGAPGSNGLAGAAYVYNCPTPRSCNLTGTLYSPNPGVNDTFGASVSVYDGLVVIGAPYHNDAQGAAYVYDCSDPWDCTYESTIIRNDGLSGEGFGYYTASYGYWALIGCPGYDNSTGSAYLYNCSDSKNCQLSYDFHAADGQYGDWYGISVGLYGWLAVVGADHKNDGNGGVYVYNCSQPNDCYEINHFDAPANSSGGNFGAFLAVYNSTLYIASYLQQNATGAVYVYNCSNGQNCSWASTLSPSGIEQGSQFGSFVAAYSNLVVVTAQNENNGQGAAYVYNCSNASNCSRVNYLNASDGAPGDYFGYAAAITEYVTVVTAPFHDIYKGEMYTYWTNQTYSATPSPSSAPSRAPTNAPTVAPSRAPTNAPTNAPTYTMP